MMTDPIADMLTRIRNAQAARKETIKVPLSKVKHKIAEILKNEGYIVSVTSIEEMPAMLQIVLKYDGKTKKIQSIKRESTPGHRVYRKADELPVVLNGYGVLIVSTSKGIMTGKEAKKLGVGGEIICSVF